jgi:hypothetical protein
VIASRHNCTNNEQCYSHLLDSTTARTSRFLILNRELLVDPVSTFDLCACPYPPRDPLSNDDVARFVSFFPFPAPLTPQHHIAPVHANHPDPSSSSVRALQARRPGNTSVSSIRLYPFHFHPARTVAATHLMQNMSIPSSLCSRCTSLQETYL